MIGFPRRGRGLTARLTDRRKPSFARTRTQTETGGRIVRNLPRLMMPFPFLIFGGSLVAEYWQAVVLRGEEVDGVR